MKHDGLPRQAPDKLVKTKGNVREVKQGLLLFSAPTDCSNSGPCMFGVGTGVSASGRSSPVTALSTSTERTEQQLVNFLLSSACPEPVLANQAFLFIAFL
jgi:hypothetical protein